MVEERSGRRRARNAAAALAGLLALACAHPKPAPPRTEAELARWRRECGLLWIITAEPGARLRITITGRFGEAVDYGNGNVFGARHLVSSFCRADRPAVQDFDCAFRTEGGARVSGTVESWFAGVQVGRWTFDKVERFTAKVHAAPQ